MCYFQLSTIAELSKQTSKTETQKWIRQFCSDKWNTEANKVLLL